MVVVYCLEEDIDFFRVLSRSHLLVGCVKLFAGKLTEAPPKDNKAHLAVFQHLVVFILLAQSTHGRIKVFPFLQI